jgi:hypothetical protein
MRLRQTVRRGGSVGAVVSILRYRVALLTRMATGTEVSKYSTDTVVE